MLDNGDLVVVPLGVQVLNIDSIVEHFTLIDVVESLDKGND